MSGEKSLEITLTNVETGERHQFRSITKACDFLGRSWEYVRNSRARGRTFLTTNAGATGRRETYTYEVEGIAKRAWSGHPFSEAKPQLCLFCKNCNDMRCRYIASCGETPIEGWAAEKTKVIQYAMSVPYEVETYAIKQCPNFEAEDYLFDENTKIRKCDKKVLQPYMKEIEDEIERRKAKKEQFAIELAKATAIAEHLSDLWKERQLHIEQHQY